MRGKSFLQLAKENLDKLEAFENAGLAWAKATAELLVCTNYIEMCSELNVRHYAQAGPWAEMLDTDNKINWI